MLAQLDKASISDSERRTVERFVEFLERNLGDDLIAVWLYGSRARGERPHPESDVDIIVLTRRGNPDRDTVSKAVWKAADEHGTNPVSFSTQLYDPAYIEDRRRIESFYIQEVDRDKIVLFGEP